MPASTEITPAVTPDSTASVKARRVSSWALAVTQRAGLLLQPAGHPVERVASVCTSSSVFDDRHPGGEVAGLDPSRGVDQLAHGPDQPVGQLQRGQIDRPTMTSATSSRQH